jgi:hypothetical protein
MERTSEMTTDCLRRTTSDAEFMRGSDDLTQTKDIKQELRQSDRQTANRSVCGDKEKGFAQLVKVNEIQLT